MSKVLPTELEGKTAEEVAAYYQEMVLRQKGVYEQALESMGGGEPAKPAAPPKTTVADWMKDPDGTASTIIKREGVSREEFNAASAAVQTMMIRQAKEFAKADLRAEAEKAGGSFEWDRLASDIDSTAAKCDQPSLTSIDTWKTAYYWHLGQKAHVIAKEAVTKATLPAESGQPGGNNPPPVKPLSREEMIVAEGLGLTTETFQSGKDRLASQKFPLTMDNRNRR